MEVAQIRIKKIRLHVICTVNTVMKKKQMSHMSKQYINTLFGPLFSAVLMKPSKQNMFKK